MEPIIVFYIVVALCITAYSIVKVIYETRVKEIEAKAKEADAQRAHERRVVVPVRS